MQVGPSGSHSRLGCSYVTRIIVNRAPNTITKPNPNHAVLFTSMQKQITRVWSFASDSNQNIEYQTLQYTDGIKSCNCRVGRGGWPQMKADRANIPASLIWARRIKAARPPTPTKGRRRMRFPAPHISHDAGEDGSNLNRLTRFFLGMVIPVDLLLQKMKADGSMNAAQRTGLVQSIVR